MQVQGRFRVWVRSCVHLLIPSVDEQAWCSKACVHTRKTTNHHNKVIQIINKYHLWMSRHGVVRLTSSQVPEADGFVRLSHRFSQVSIQ